MSYAPRKSQHRASATRPSPDRRHQDASDDLRACVESLIRHLQEHPVDTPARADLPADVLLDTQVDDVRCLVIRVPADSPRDRIQLSPREHEIVRMVAAGHPNKTIAAVLEISCWTVGTYLRRIFAKLGVGSRAAMVARIAGEPRVPAAPVPSGPSGSVRFRRAG